MRLSSRELEREVDLTPFMQRHPFVVPADAQLSRAYRLFRTMGLRHMFVAPERQRIVGMVTRKDLILENAALTLLERAADSAKTGAGVPYDLPFEEPMDSVLAMDEAAAGDAETGFGGISGARARRTGAGGGAAAAVGLDVDAVGPSSLSNVDL